ncbi:MAG: hypothetical protein AAF985_22715, partial [Bacteroidota bacterium]
LLQNTETNIFKIGIHISKGLKPSSDVATYGINYSFKCYPKKIGLYLENVSNFDHGDKVLRTIQK